jgi:hypothetical protein
MKKKVTTRKVEVRNRGFIAAIRQSFSIRAEQHAEMAQKVRSSGVVDTLITVNKSK